MDQFFENLEIMKVLKQHMKKKKAQHKNIATVAFISISNIIQLRLRLYGLNPVQSN